MNIGIDSRTLSDRQYSGVPEFSYNLIKNLLLLDKVNNYFLFFNSARDLSKTLPDFSANNLQVIQTRWPNKILNYLGFKILNYPKIERLLEIKLDIFFMPHMNFIAFGNAYRKIITVHDLSFLRYPEFFSWRKNFWHHQINLKKLLNKFDKVIAISNSTKLDLIELCNVPENKISVIYSGLNEQFKVLSESEKNITKQKLGLPDKFILFVSTIEPRKNLEGLILAFEQFKKNNSNNKEYRLVVVGGQGWKNRDVLKLAQVSEFSKDIVFLGYINQVDKTALYNLAQVLVYPSFYEGFGFPPLEAMACGVPIITSSNSSMPETTGEAVVLVDPFDVNQIANALNEIINNLDFRSHLIDAGFKQIKRFSWEKTAQAYLDAFGLD